jgi:hypothetical protein
MALPSNLTFAEMYEGFLVEQDQRRTTASSTSRAGRVSWLVSRAKDWERRRRSTASVEPLSK